MTWFNPNPEQIKEGVRWLINSFAVALAAWGAKKGVDLGFVGTEAFIGFVGSLAVLVWGYVSKSTRNMVKAVDKLPEVKGVITQPTLPGKELALSIPSPNVAPAGSPAAIAIVRKETE